MHEIPQSRRRTCQFCAEIVDSNAAGVYQLAQGWLENRRKGGANAIALGKRYDQFACHECINKLKAGIPVGQLSIFKANDYQNP